MTTQDGWLTVREIGETVWPVSKQTISRYVKTVDPSLSRANVRKGNKGTKGKRPRQGREYHYACLPTEQLLVFESRYRPHLAGNRLAETFVTATEIRLDMRRPIGRQLIVRIPAVSRPHVSNSTGHP